MRKHRHILALMTALSLFGASGLSEEVHVWTSRANGRQFKGALVKVDEDLISIRRESDNVIFQVKKTDLIPKDLDWIKENAPKDAAAAAGPVEDLSNLIAGVPAAMKTPAIGVLLILDGETRGIGVSGLRKAGGTEKVEPEDKWHLGSCTKSMTATLAGTLVEEGRITWETTISEVLGKEIKMLKPYESVTVGMLLAHRSGIPGSPPDSVYAGIETGARLEDLKDRELLKQRLLYAEAALNLNPSSEPDSAYEYSNAGYIVAGAMLEQVTGKPWERLMEERIFKPLGMADTGFGNAARDDKSNPTQPWPHQKGMIPVSPGPGDDNPWVLGPAGTVHGSLKDLARYISMHATREIGPVLKKKETYEYLHTAVPQNNDYARGWIVTATAWSNGPAIAHDGSNTMNHSSIWIAPDRKAGLAAFTNSDENGVDVCRKAIELVVDKYLK